MRVIADQFTSGLVAESRGFRSRLADALASARSSSDRIAIGQEVAFDAQRRRTDFARALEVVAGRRERGESRAVAVGDGCCPPGVNTQPQCTIDGRRMCDYDRVGHRTLTTAGNGVFSLIPQPSAGNSWWRPKMVRSFAHLTSNPSVPAWEGLFITSITVGTSPVEGFNNPAAATIQDGIHFGDYVVPDTSAVPVGWPKFSNTANSNQLILSGIGLWPVASAFIAYVTVLGNTLNDAGQDCRVNDKSPRVPAMPTGGPSTGVAGRNYRPA